MLFAYVVKYFAMCFVMCLVAMTHAQSRYPTLQENHERRFGPMPNTDAKAVQEKHHNHHLVHLPPASNMLKNTRPNTRGLAKGTQNGLPKYTQNVPTSHRNDVELTAQ